MLIGVRRAFSEFLAVPALMLAGFAGLAIGMLLVDHSSYGVLDDARETMTELVFGDSEATSNLLGTIAGALITVTGLAFALLLLALSQSAASLSQVFSRRASGSSSFGRMRPPSATSSPARSGSGVAVRSSANGYVTALDLDQCAAALEQHAGAEIVLRVPIGTYVAHGDVLAEIRNAAGEELVEEVRCSIRLEPVRDLTLDPGYGIDQFVSIAWKSISTSTKSPAPGESVIHALRDLLGRWATGAEPSRTHGPQVPVVYEDDVLATLWDAIDSMAVVCSESMQA